MSSTQGHTNIHTVHTTVDISVLLDEINRIADDSYTEGFESGYDVGVKKGKADTIEPIQKFIDCYDGAIIISDSLGVMSGQSLIDELKEIIKEQLKENNT